MLVGSVRSSKFNALVIGVVVFITAFAALVYNQLDSWELPTRPQTDSWSNSPSTQAPKAKSAEAQLRSTWFDHLHKPSIKPDAPFYQPYGAFKWDLKSEPKFPEPMGEELCIIDLDNRPFDAPDQIFGPHVMSWKNASQIHGLSMGVLNHWLYAKIHGYKYYFIAIDTPEDRRASWKKPPIISKILKDHKTCLYLDSDAIFHNLDLPFEWLMNYWDIDPATNSLALAVDPDREFNKDKKGKLMLNTGFIVAQNNPKTYEIMNAWEGCPEANGRYPECVEFRLNDPGRPTDQGGFGTYVRYDYPNDIKELSCQDANGYPDSGSDCEGKFIRHLWTGKDSWIKIFVGEQVPGPYLEMFHKEYLAEKSSFYITEKQLMGR
ncbi:hypothetical protein PT974_10945 [Cladobotryum mycophilum]|uniref:Galactosyl transferase n=1 Tax=Cladobotryum mycophilum TaxID=491253 RepID=A0ABR0SB79_9HYPO